MTKDQSEQQARETALKFLKKYQVELDHEGWSDDMCEKILVDVILATQAACLEEAIKSCEHELSTAALNGDAQFGARLMLETLREQAQA